MNAIEVQNLRRVFRTTLGVFKRSTKEVVAVDDVSFDVASGELFGLLGPNGAGKTTSVKMLTTLLIPTEGSARILGHDVVKEAEAIRPRIGFIFGGERGLYWRLSAIDNLRYFATLYQLDPEVTKKRIPYLLESGRVERSGPRESRRLFARHEAASAHCTHVIARSGTAVFGRTLDRAGSGGGARDAPDRAQSPIGEEDDPADDALYVRGGCVVPAHRRDQSRAHHRVGYAGRS